MTSKERVSSGLNKKPVDLVPVFIWFHTDTVAQLARRLEIPHSEVGWAMGNDVAMIQVNNNWAMEGIVNKARGERHTDPWGITWEKQGALIKPHLKQVAHVGRQSGLWTAYHCCGAMAEIIPDLIEIGIDILNPIQVGCLGMDPLQLKREYGADLAFMGGVDAQNLLPRGRAADEEIFDNASAIRNIA